MLNLYINLDTAGERRDWMEHQFSALGIKAERISAVTIGEVSSKAGGTTFGNRMGRPWLGAEKACALSHRECWKRIVDGNDEFGTIFEDDVHLASDAAEFVTDSAWIPSGVDVVKLETYLQKVWIAKRPVPARGRALHRLNSNHRGSAGYILSREAAATLLEKTTNIEMPLDHLIFDPVYNFGLKVWQLSDAICIQDDCLNTQETRFKSLISCNADRAVNRRGKPASMGKKILRELTRIYLQAYRPMKNLARSIKERHTVIYYRQNEHT
ncbi:hypothetical protein B6V72_18880 [Thioclava sp. F34-6]|uniref:glycosyltransferase family 25 protein n=1 Tax=Thioclava sp. F34-6 TaxID=1973003 RepID=UPI000B540E00|nr:glycosyltransferase family 25 protein [Thioclava sp. F34-6]OWY07497.1 hypothetical protein B6V72_18880 [Thioclava sp. F34-6]